MGFFSGLSDLLTGGLAGTVLNTVEKYFPPDMSPEQKAQMQLALEKLELEKKIEANKALGDAEKTLNDRIAMYEGTASDLKSVPILGAFMLFLRGAQRPIWGFGAIYMDYMVMSGLWTLTTDTIQSAFYIINILVLSFLFGERAVTNVLPLITNFLAAKKGKGE